LTVAADVSSSGVLITVQDTGVGISKRGIVELFTPFYTTKPDGAGLGLSMCKQVVEAHGGSIRLESEEGLGCKVELCLPISAVDRSIVSPRG
jgi:signal transduction histidine kinase